MVSPYRVLELGSPWRSLQLGCKDVIQATAARLVYRIAMTLLISAVFDRVVAESPTIIDVLIELDQDARSLGLYSL